MKLKEGVRLVDIQPQIVLAIIVANDIYKEKCAELVVTSLNDGKHSVNSLHYKGMAVDLRTRMFMPDDAIRVRNELSVKLGNDYDVIYENDHIHIEYDPK